MLWNIALCTVIFPMLLIVIELECVVKMVVSFRSVAVTNNATWKYRQYVNELQKRKQTGWGALSFSHIV
jgi:hypothetical protein